MDDDESAIMACARAAHEANRAYCAAIGDDSQVPWDAAPEWQRESARKGVRGVLDGNTPEQSHESWLAEKVSPCIVPFSHLPTEQRQKDHVFVAVVKAMAAALNLTVAAPRSVRRPPVEADAGPQPRRK